MNRCSFLNYINNISQKKSSSGINFLTKQSIAQTVVDGLDLGVVLQGVRAEFTADTRALEASEGSLVRDQVVVVDPHSTVKTLENCINSSRLNKTYPARRALETRMAVLTFLV